MAKLYVQASKFRGSGLALNPAVIAEYAHKQLSACFRDSIKAFVYHTINHTLIETGMSRGQLLPLAAFVKYKQVARAEAQKGMKKAFRLGVTSISGVYNPTAIRTMGTGTELGESSYKVDYGTKSNAIMIMSFINKVWQFKMHEKDQQALAYGGKKLMEFLMLNWRKYLDKKAIISYLVSGSKIGLTSTLERSYFNG